MTFKYFLISLLTLLIKIKSSNSYNILVAFGHNGKSHYEVFGDLFVELGSRGHNVTILGHVPVKGHSNVTYIPWSETPMTHVLSLQESIKINRVVYYLMPKQISDFADVSCKENLMYSSFQKFLKQDNHFDIILVEFFNTNCYYGLITKYKAPFIGLSSSTLFPWHPEWFGARENPAYSQVIFMGYKTPMTFLERVENTLLHVFDNLWYKYAMEKPGHEYSKKYIGYEAPDPHNASLVFTNTHYSLHGARPLTPSIIEVGGIHVNGRKPKKLPEAIENWINNSDAGVIYFSLGSMIKGDTFPEEQRKAFVRAFSRLPQRVLWKWENDTMPDKPDNVMISKWMPQFDILCHPNVKAFISHGGMLGTTEAVYCGVSIVAMPQFGDQRHNAFAVENKGSGVVLYLVDATEETVFEALQKVLHPRTFKNAQALSARFRDRPLSPMDTAIYWIEHVARHKGADHMRSPATNMPFYQYFLLDVIAFLAVVFLVLNYVLYRILRLVLGLFTRNNREGKQKIS